MQLIDYTLRVKHKCLINKDTIHLKVGAINHILGKNGVGKSQFGIDLFLGKNKAIPAEMKNNVTLISSNTNVPNDITPRFLYQMLSKKFSKDSVDALSNMLDTSNINPSVLIKKLSDGQKQKLKIITFLCEDKGFIVLDEITNSLDKGSVREIQAFLNQYIQHYPDKTIINITHNLSDLKTVGGVYKLLDQQKMTDYQSAETLIQDYINH
ncbi:ATP-binding cassette domain-containing protein [Staphylococcus delphini]|uniref:ATP-binding cassette domain-containing protein n=1 Tax=Staphylococcus delphini TaxID=53344 RepID=UPI00374F6E9F